MDLRDELLAQRLYHIFHTVDGLGHLPVRPLCHDGVVYLRGKVDTPQNRELMITLARQVTGVKGVVSQLTLFAPRQAAERPETGAGG